MKKLAIVGASYLQVPLIKTACEMELETHVFAWEEGAIGKDICQQFYPISITEKEQILEICETLRIDGITSISSDLAMPTVNYIAGRMGLIGNSADCTLVTTNKFAMRQRLSHHGLPCPRFMRITSMDEWAGNDFRMPCIIKPTDRSGSRGVRKIHNREQLEDGLEKALAASLVKEAIVEEFIEGRREISVEMVTWKGTHHFITCTDKVSTGEPHFVEIGQHVPALIPADLQNRIVALVKEALTVLGVTYGASHSEILITEDGQIFIVEIGARMGGDNIGSDLVPLYTGYDFVKGIIEIALGEFTLPRIRQKRPAGICFLTPKAGRVTRIVDNTPDFGEVVRSEVLVQKNDQIHYPVVDSAQRSAYIIYTGERPVDLDPGDVITIHTE
jgi:biotin carboxylase